MATATNTTTLSEIAAASRDPLGIRAAIEAARQPRPYPDVKAAPVRRFRVDRLHDGGAALESRLRSAGHGHGAASAFDAEFERYADAAFAACLTKPGAGRALRYGCLHLRTADWRPPRPTWGRWSRMAPQSRSEWLARSPHAAARPDPVPLPAEQRAPRSKEAANMATTEHVQRRAGHAQIRLRHPRQHSRRWVASPNIPRGPQEVDPSAGPHRPACRCTVRGTTYR